MSDHRTLWMLDYLEQRELSEPLRTLLRATGRTSGRLAARLNLGRLATLLDLDQATVHHALTRRAPLRALGLVECDDGFSDLEDFLTPTGLLREVLAATPRDAEALLALLIEPAPAGASSSKFEGLLRPMVDAARTIDVLNPEHRAAHLIHPTKSPVL